MISVRRTLQRRLMNHPGRRTAAKARPCLESLESRVVPYATTGNMWPNTQLITISFMPDGTSLGAGVTSNLSSSFSSLAGWQTVILKAAQTWAKVADINFAVVPDDGEPEGAGSDQQGDPNFGDIRIGGYNFGSSTLANATFPPPVNNFSAAGDIFFNTGQSFNIGTTYDLFTVAVHEIGHALGLDHSTTSGLNEMYPYYNGVKPNLSGDDIAGIQSIYGARPLDNLEQAGYGGSFATAGWLNWGAPSGTNWGDYSTNGLQINSSFPAEYFGVTVPQGTNGNFTLTVTSRGISLFDPKVTIYAADQSTVLGQTSGGGQDGTTVAITLYNVTAGENLYIKVQGYDSSAFGYGAYEILTNFAPTSGVWQPSSEPAPNQLDNLEQAGYGSSISTAGWLNWGAPASTNWGVYSNDGLQINATFPSETFAVTVPQGTNGNFTLMATSRGISQLDPKVTIYAADGTTVLAQGSGGGQDGTTVALTIYNVTAGENLYIKVQGDGTPAGEYGAYELLVDFAPTFGVISVPNNDPPVPNGSPLHGGSGEADSLPASAPAAGSVASGPQGGGGADSVPGPLDGSQHVDTLGASTSAFVHTHSIPHVHTRSIPHVHTRSIPHVYTHSTPRGPLTLYTKGHRGHDLTKQPA